MSSTPLRQRQSPLVPETEKPTPRRNCLQSSLLQPFVIFSILAKRICATDCTTRYKHNGNQKWEKAEIYCYLAFFLTFNTYWKMPKNHFRYNNSSSLSICLSQEVSDFSRFYSISQLFFCSYIQPYQYWWNRGKAFELHLLKTVHPKLICFSFQFQESNHANQAAKGTHQQRGQSVIQA